MAVIVKVKKEEKKLDGQPRIARVLEEPTETFDSSKEKRLIMTRTDLGAEPQAAISHPIFRHFAYKWNADFIALNRNPEIPMDNKDKRLFYRTFISPSLFYAYDRILILDSDIILSPSCPNIFEEVPSNKIGLVMEDQGYKKDSRLFRIKQIQDTYGDIGWISGYPNSGFMIFSKQHAHMFDSIGGSYFEQAGTDCVQIGYNISKWNLPYMDLGYQWNHMTMFSENWNGSPDRFDSHVIHYAGIGIFEPQYKDKTEQMVADYEKLWADRIG